MASEIQFLPKIAMAGVFREEADAREGLELENGLMNSTGKPPRGVSLIRHCASTTRFSTISDVERDIDVIDKLPPRNDPSEFSPVFRSGSCSVIGPKASMEDEFICIDSLRDQLSADLNIPSFAAFYGVFDGHGGIDAALFVRKNLLNFIIHDSHFPHGVKDAVMNAFLKADHAFVDNTTALDTSSGTTALIALILEKSILVANVGDSRAVLSKRGRAVELSKDHKPTSTSEKIRIEETGGSVYDGYLNGQLSVARALGDWHLKGAKGSICALISEPEFEEMDLCEEDEFMIMGCDGLWDVMSSQCAVSMVRKSLVAFNDPERCCREVVREALSRNSCDNLTVLVVCFSRDPPPLIDVPKSNRKRSISAEGLDLLKGILGSV